MSAPRISICIPTVDRLPYLRESVASAQAQRLHELEILIADDGDSRALREWAMATAAAHRRVRYVKTPQRLGLAGNWNFLADTAAGEFIAVIGDDDRLLPDFAERLLREAASDVDVVFSQHYYIDAAGRRLMPTMRDGTHASGRESLVPGVLANAAEVVWRNSVPMSASIIRASAVRRLRFKSDLNTPEIELFARLAGERGRFVFVPDFLAEFRVHAHSEGARRPTLDRLAEYLERIEVPLEVEPAKRAFVAPLVSAGIGICLTRRDIVGARRLRASRYYTGDLTRLAQRVSLSLPDRLAAGTYAMLRRVRWLARGIAPIAPPPAGRGVLGAPEPLTQQTRRLRPASCNHAHQASSGSTPQSKPRQGWGVL